MAQHNVTGEAGEHYAVKYLKAKGYTILFRNWRFGHYEVDIIAQEQNKVHFIEVKTRTNLTYGYPEEAVTRKKLKHLMNSANHFLYSFPSWDKIQFDILSVFITFNRDVEFTFIEDVYL